MAFSYGQRTRPGPEYWLDTPSDAAIAEEIQGATSQSQDRLDWENPTRAVTGGMMPDAAGAESAWYLRNEPEVMRQVDEEIAKRQAATMDSISRSTAATEQRIVAGRRDLEESKRNRAAMAPGPSEQENTDWAMGSPAGRKAVYEAAQRGEPWAVQEMTKFQQQQRLARNQPAPEAAPENMDQRDAQAREYMAMQRAAREAGGVAPDTGDPMKRYEYQQRVASQKAALREAAVQGLRQGRLYYTPQQEASLAQLDAAEAALRSDVSIPPARLQAAIAELSARRDRIQPLPTPEHRIPPSTEEMLGDRIVMHPELGPLTLDSQGVPTGVKAEGGQQFTRAQESQQKMQAADEERQRKQAQYRDRRRVEIQEENRRKQEYRIKLRDNIDARLRKFEETEDEERNKIRTGPMYDDKGKFKQAEYEEALKNELGMVDPDNVEYGSALKQLYGGMSQAELRELRKDPVEDMQIADYELMQKQGWVEARPGGVAPDNMMGTLRRATPEQLQQLLLDAEDDPVSEEEFRARGGKIPYRRYLQQHDWLQANRRRVVRLLEAEKKAKVKEDADNPVVYAPGENPLFPNGVRWSDVQDAARSNADRLEKEQEAKPAAPAKTAEEIAAKTAMVDIAGKMLTDRGAKLPEKKGAAGEPFSGKAKKPMAPKPMSVAVAEETLADLKARYGTPGKIPPAESADFRAAMAIVKAHEGKAQ